MTLRVLVVGCGSIGARHISNLLELPDIDVIAHDTVPQKTESLSDEYDIFATTDFEEALTSGIDCVFVCTPPASHLDIASAALDEGAHVFIEKPLSDSVKESEKFVNQVDDSDQLAFVACNMRFHPPVVQIQEWLDDGEIGQLQFFRLRYGNDLRNWRSTDYQESYSSNSDEGGGIVLDGVHELDLALKWMDDIDRVSASVGQVSDLEINVEDVSEIILESGNRMAEIHLDYIRPERARTYELIGNKGMIRWMARGKNPEVSTVELHQRNSDDVVREEFESTLNEQYVYEIEHFVACVRGTETPEMDARRGYEVLRLATLAKKSDNSQKSVKFIKTDWEAGEF